MKPISYTQGRRGGDHRVPLSSKAPQERRRVGPRCGTPPTELMSRAARFVGLILSPPGRQASISVDFLKKKRVFIYKKKTYR